jgi:hypothetical protein
VLAEAAKEKLDVAPIAGAKLAALVERLYSSPAEVVALVKKINAAH